MKRIIKRVIKDCSTGIDGISFDVIRVLFQIAMIVGMGLEIYSVIFDKKFDILSYGAGISSLLLTCGAALGMKAKTEPGEKSDDHDIPIKSRDN